MAKFLLLIDRHASNVTSILLIAKVVPKMINVVHVLEIKYLRQLDLTAFPVLMAKSLLMIDRHA